MGRFDYTLPVTAVETEDFGTVHLRPLKASEYFSGDDNEQGVQTAARLVAISICEADGSDLTEPVTPEQVASWPLRSFDALSAAVLEINGLKKKVSRLANESPSASPSALDAPTSDASLAK